MANPVPLSVTTPLPAADLRFESMSFSAGLSSLDEIRLRLISDRSDVEPEEVLGEPVDIVIELRDGAKRYINGYVTRFGIGRHRGRYFGYEAEVHPWLWFLTRTSNCRIFQEQKVDEIVSTVFAGHAAVAKYEFNLYRGYRKRTYCVQYRETDFNFVTRLLEDEGIFWYIDHSQGEHTLVLVDDVDAIPPAAGCDNLTYYANVGQAPPDTEYISDWHFSRGVETSKAVLLSYDFERPLTKLLVEKQAGKEFQLANKEYFDFQGDYTQKADGEQTAENRVEEIQAHHARLRGLTNAHGVTAGKLFTLDRHPRSDQNGSYVCVRTEISAQLNAEESGNTPGDFQCSFAAIPSNQQFRPPRHTQKPFVQGPQTAIVVGPQGAEIFTDKYGRVKVQFHWDRFGKNDERSSCWIRVSHPWAGKGWGAVSIPRIGQEVIVDFLEGDPDQPIITGRVYNAANMPPYPLPEGAVVSGMKSKSHKAGGYNEISADDTAGKEKITVHGQYDMATTVEHDQTDTVHNNRSATVDVDDTEHVGANQKLSVGGNRSASVSGNQSLDVGGKQTIGVAGTRSLTVGGADTTKLGASRSLTIAAADTVAIGAARKTTVGGADTLSVTGGRSVDVGAALSVTAASSITLTVGGSSIKIEPGGIDIAAPKVTINGSGGVTITGAIVKVNS
jgi:type VI secretion system secreted protein VgrG